MAIRTISDTDLREFSDDHLSRQIENMRRLAKKKDSDFTRKVQTELCYLQREMDWRQTRRVRHKIYLQNLHNQKRFYRN